MTQNMLVQRRGIALVSVLYFLVVCALTITAVLFAQRTATRSTRSSAGAAQLFASADEALYAALATWSGVERARQSVGSTLITSASTRAGITTSTLITRVTASLYALVAESVFGGSGPTRRVSMLVRVPLESWRMRGGLVSAVDVSVGPDVRFSDDSTCGEPLAAAIVLAPSASLNLDAGIPPGMQPSVVRDSTALDSTIYLRVGDVWWSELAARADVRFSGNVSITPSAQVSGGRCVDGDANWGDPLAGTSPCGARAPVVHVSGDLTIEGGAGQGVLLVDGHLAITGPFTYSGQIVARHGIETRADNIAISGVVYAWRASADSTASRPTTNEVMLTHATTIRRSVCDAHYGIASWQQPQRVRERAWIELF
jgi:hypothetical protein